MNFHSERPNRENGTTFSEFPFVPGIFQWKERNKISTFAPKIWWSAVKLQRLVPKQVIFRITFRLTVCDSSFAKRGFRRSICRRSFHQGNI